MKPPTRPDTLLAGLEGLHTLSCRMREAAEANDWDQLASLEREQAELRQHMAKLPPPASTSATDALKMETLIRQTLENDAVVRSHVEPWMNSARKLLATGRQGRAMRAAYGANGPR